MAVDPAPVPVPAPLPPCAVGIDVAKHKLDVFVSSTAEYLSLPNEPKAIATLAQKLTDLNPQVIVIEHTGGYQRNVALTLMDAGLPVALVNPRQTRDHAHATQQWAKTDRLDAKLLAHFGLTCNPRLSPRPSEAQHQLGELVTRRRQLVAMRTSETLHVERLTNPRLQRTVQQHMRSLDQMIERVEAEIAKLIENDDDWRDQYRILSSVPGVGATTAATLLAQLPQLGEINRSPLAALVGLAPFARESGGWKGKRSCRGGRAPVRNALYMATVCAVRCNPVIAAMYKRLKATGKASKVCLVACMRKLLIILNALLRKGETWQPLNLKNA
jgi:transposase